MLFLAKNKLTFLKLGVFYRLLKLRNLDLSHNEITVLPLAIFDGLRNLKVFKMNNNQLKYLEVSSSHVAHSVLRLDLSNNNLNDVTNLMDFEKIEDLDLSGNRKLDLTLLLCNTLTNLLSLTLNNANIKLENFQFLAPLKKLMERLSIADNNFHELNISILPNLPNLNYLNLKQHNSVKLLDHTIMKNRFPQLKTIIISPNGWSCKFLKDMISYFNEVKIDWLNKNEADCHANDEHSKTNPLTIAGVAVFMITLILIIVTIIYVIQKMIK
jgi:Leucine-rich repeat (LRR) protein